MFSLSLSLSVWPLRLPLCCVVEYTCIRQLEVRRVTSLTPFVLLHVLWLWFETVPFVVVFVVGLAFHFFVAPFSLLAVFEYAIAFNSDVSNWNTGAVTTMYGSKCTCTCTCTSLSLSLPLCGHGAFRCGVVLNIYDNSRFVGSQVSHVLFFFLIVV